eukprot:273961_1
MESHWNLVISILNISICIYAAILAVILTYYWRKFIHISTGTTVKPKDKRLIHSIIISSIFGLIIETPFIVYCHTWNINNYINKWVVSAINSAYIAFILLLYCIYLWLLFYYKKYHIAIAEITWKKAINERYRSWYIVKKQTLGNLNSLIKISTIPFIICVFIGFVSEHFLFLHNLSFHLIIVLLILFLAMSITIYCKLRKYNDIFRIKKEIKYQCTAASIFLIICCMLNIGEIISEFIPKQRIFIQLILSISTTTVLFTMSFILITFSLQQAQSMKLQPSMPPRTPTITKIASSSQPNSRATPTTGINGMLQLIGDNKGFKGFMNHLCECFATENLLFVVELIQIKYEFQLEHNMYVSKTNTPARSRRNTLSVNTDLPQMNMVIEDDFVNDDIEMNVIENEQNMDIIPEAMIIEFEKEIHDIEIPSRRGTVFHSRASSVKSDDGAASLIHNSDGSLYAKITLPYGLPRSELLNTKILFLDRLYALYLKYIKPGCIHQINISHYQKIRITQCIDKMLKEKKNAMNDKNSDIDTTGYSMFDVMDGACIQVLQLMVDSYDRYIKNNCSNVVPKKK